MSGSGGGSSCPTVNENALNTKYNMSVASIALPLFIVGVGIGLGAPYLLKLSKEKHPKATKIIKVAEEAFVESGPQRTAQYAPVIILLAVAFCFLVGIIYVVDRQVKDKSKMDAKVGIQTAVGLAWGLFVITAILTPIALHYANISLGSYYYIMATALVFYFTCIVVIITYYNKLSNVDPTSKSYDVTDTHNVQNGLIAGLIAYGIGALLML
jgi:hypothetical protein